MKRLLPSLVTIVLFVATGLSSARGDMISVFPRSPAVPPKIEAERKARERHECGYPTYGIVAGVVALALSGSFVALRRIRRHGS